MSKPKKSSHMVVDPKGEITWRNIGKAGLLGQEVMMLDPWIIADALIVQTGNHPYWPNSAREMIAGQIAEVQRNPNRHVKNSVIKSNKKA